MLRLTYIDTQLGKMIAGASDEGICLFDFEYRKSIQPIIRRIETGLKDTFVENDSPYFEILKLQMEEYFRGGTERV